MASVSQHFRRSEFACNCGCGCDTADSGLVEALEAIRTHFNKKVKITSAHRCDAHNRAVGGSPNSQHKKGRASDIQVEDTPPSVVADYAETLGVSVGRYSTFTHIDSRSGPPAMWGSN